MKRLKIHPKKRCKGKTGPLGYHTPPTLHQGPNTERPDPRNHHSLQKNLISFIFINRKPKNKEQKKLRNLKHHPTLSSPAHPVVPVTHGLKLRYRCVKFVSSSVKPDPGVDICNLLPHLDAPSQPHLDGFRDGIPQRPLTVVLPRPMRNQRPVASAFLSSPDLCTQWRYTHNRQYLPSAYTQVHEIYDTQQF